MTAATSSTTNGTKNSTVFGLWNTHCRRLHIAISLSNASSAGVYCLLVAMWMWSVCVPGALAGALCVASRTRGRVKYNNETQDCVGLE